MSKYVFCDLDYTLLDNNRDISKENDEAIKEFEKNGNHFIICSGRVPFALKQYVDFFNASEVISSNGSIIFSNKKIIKKVLLDKGIIFLITEYALKNKINIRYFCDDYMLVLNKEYGSINAFMYAQCKVLHEEDVFDILKDEEIIKLVICSDNPMVLEKAKNDFEKMKLDVEIVYSSSVFLEINAIHQNKGNGVIDYCNYNHIDLKDTVSIGDNDNDLSMLKVTGFSACPSNSLDIIKKNVDYVCVNDNDHSAVKEVLKKIGEYE